MSMSIRHLVIPLFVFSAGAMPARGQDSKDSLAAYAANKTLTKDDRAKIEVEVIRRAQKLRDATTEAQRKDAKDALIETVQIAGATPAFVEHYSNECGTQLAGLTGNERRELAIDAALILVTIDHEATADGLAAALASPHPGVRYVAVRGIQKLGKRLKTSSRAAAVLAALGTAGATESNEVVLPRIFQAISGVDAKFNKEAAGAWATVIQGRVAQLTGGGRIQDFDISGVKSVSRVRVGSESASGCAAQGHRGIDRSGSPALFRSAAGRKLA
jgi:hypothetical protein